MNIPSASALLSGVALLLAASPARTCAAGRDFKVMASATPGCSTGADAGHPGSGDGCWAGRMGGSRRFRGKWAVGWTGRRSTTLLRCHGGLRRGRGGRQCLSGLGRSKRHEFPRRSTRRSLAAENDGGGNYFDNIGLGDDGNEPEPASAGAGKEIDEEGAHFILHLVPQLRQTGRHGTWEG